MTRALNIIAHNVQDSGGLCSLLDLCQQPGFLPPLQGRIMLPSEVDFFQKLACHWEVQLPQVLIIRPPNALPLLAHWLILRELLLLAGPRVQREILEMEPRLTPPELPRSNRRWSSEQTRAPRDRGFQQVAGRPNSRRPLASTRSTTKTAAGDLVGKHPNSSGSERARASPSGQVILRSQIPTTHDQMVSESATSTQDTSSLDVPTGKSSQSAGPISQEEGPAAKQRRVGAPLVARRVDAATWSSMTRSARKKLTRRIKQQRSADIRTGRSTPATRPSSKQGNTAGSSTQVAVVSTPVSKGSSSAPAARASTVSTGAAEAAGRLLNKGTQQGPRTFAEAASGSNRSQKVSSPGPKSSKKVPDQPSTSSGTQSGESGKIEMMDTSLPEPKMQGVDTHFHLVRLANLVRRRKPLGKCIAFSSVLRDVFVPAEVPDQPVLDFVVSSFCDDWFHKQLLFGPRRKVLKEELLQDPRLKLAFGLHPKSAHDLMHEVAGVIHRLKRLMTLPNVVAFGEVGLDYSVPRKTWDSQREFLLLLLDGLKDSLKGKPIQIHCRDGKEGKPMGTLLGVLTQVLPPDQLIQVHYFKGTRDDVGKWLEAFPNTHFSVGVSIWSASPQQVDGLKAVPWDRLLLETDSPASMPNGRPSSPFSIWEVALKVAELRNVQRAKVLRVTRDNAHRFFKVA